MSWPKKVHQTIKKLHKVNYLLKQSFTGRDQAVDLLILSTISQEHLLFVGDPGTAKTEIINRFTEMVDARGFHYLLTRFTEPSELFGPLDLAEFKEGKFSIRTDKMLPEAEIAFLDEVFQGSSAILNSLLTILNERMFFNGFKHQAVPLISMVGASNLIPDDPWLRAFADRFVLRLEMNSIEDDFIDDLLERGWQLERDKIDAVKRSLDGQAKGTEVKQLSVSELMALNARLLEVNLSSIRPLYGRLIREFRAEGVSLSDRGAVKGLKLIAAACLLRESDTADVPDLWPLLHIWDRPEEADVLKEIIHPRLIDAGVDTIDAKRPVADILVDLETLQAQTHLLTTESALGAHLMAINKLRTEIINDHPKDLAARNKIESVIKDELKRFEGK
jgi:MoxR-like ATPase